MLEAVIFIGIQASGKSTFFREKFFDTHVRINLDMLRNREREKCLLRACLEAKQSFVVDNTNPTILEREVYISQAKAEKFRVIGYYFEVNIEKSLQRNALRKGKQCIPEVGIRATRNRLQKPSVSEGFDQLFFVQLTEEGFVVKDFVEGKI